NMTLRIRLSSQDQTIHFEVKRPGREGTIAFDLEPRRDPTADVPSIGISPSQGLTLHKPPFVAPAGLVGGFKSPVDVLRPNDKIVAAGPPGTEPVPVADVNELYRIFAKHLKEPVDVVAERRTPSPSGAGKPPVVTRVTATVPPNHFVDFGLRLKIEPIAA